MKLDQLVYFLEAAKHQHIGKAANIVAISPSAISHSIASLERELGRELFVKKGKNIFLTSHGKVLMERTKRLLEEVERVKEDLASPQVELEGYYRLAASHLLCSKLLAPAWTQIQNRNPKLTAEIYSLRSAQVISGVASGEWDFGLCFSPQSHPGVHLQPVYKGRLLLAVRNGHPILKSKAGDRIRQLSEYPATLPKAFQGVENCEAHPIFRKYGLVPTVKFIFDNYEVAVECLLYSSCWGFLPDWIVKLYPGKLVSIIPQGWNAPFTISALWPKSRLLTRVLKELTSTIQKQARR